MNADSLSFYEKVGQRFIIGVNNYNIDSIIYLIKNYYIGGIILYKKNYKSYSELLEVVKKLKNANKDNKIPLFIAIDQEGGVVNRLPKEFDNLINIYDVSSTDKALVQKHSMIIAKILSDSGINMNLGPVLDIYNNSKSKALYKRCFHGNVSDIEDCLNLYIKEFRKEKIVTVGKHFPGHGVTKFDSHFFIPYVFNYKKILNEHILPFEEAIKKNIDVLMLGHIVIRKMSGLLPTTLSDKFILKYLRNKYNYNGLVMTDEINMLSRNIIYRWCYVDRAIRADNDLILVKLKDKDSAIKMLERARKISNVERTNEQVKRLLKVKEKYKINDKISFDGINIEKINKEINNINKQVITNR